MSNFDSKASVFELISFLGGKQSFFCLVLEMRNVLRFDVGLQGLEKKNLWVLFRFDIGYFEILDLKASIYWLDLGIQELRGILRDFR